MPTIAQSLLPEFDRETANTRTTLERVPENFDFRPHEKSPTLGWLASHLAVLPTWVKPTLQQDRLDMGGGDGPATEATTREEVLELFDRNVAEAREALASAEDDVFAEAWTLAHEGRELFTMPKGVVLRTWVFSHMIHHRAQLGVYLRMNDVPVPALYGPTADEPSF